MSLTNQDIIRSLFPKMRYGDIIFIGRSPKTFPVFNLAIIHNDRIIGQTLGGIFLEKGNKKIILDEKAIVNKYVIITHIKNLSEAVRNKEFDQSYLNNIVRNFTSADETISEMTILALKEISEL